ncbi:MAG: CheR family methyltransferase [Vicinamibacteria bacterium]
MRAAPAPEDLEQFRTLIARRLGLHFEDGKLGQLAEVLGRRLEAVGEASQGYFARLQTVPLWAEESRALARDLTVSETYFFRYIDQLRAFADVALPERMRARSDRRRLQVLSAGCASGEEPFTLAMLLAERMPDPSWTVSIRAVDLNPAALEKAARGRYSPWALRETPSADLRRWFRQEGPDFVVADAIRQLVAFEERNLNDADADLWRPASYDVVFCRNVLMYFTRENAQALVSRIAAALSPGGYLFLGHAETLRGLSQDFHLKHTNAAFYYQRRSAPAANGPMATAAEDHGDVVPLEQALDQADGWVDAIRRASDRIQTLARGSAAAPAPPHRPDGGAPSQAGWSLGSARELLEAERFGEALELVHALPAASASDPGVMLLRATLLTHGGRLHEAERSCQELLRRDELNAGAHYLLALCREGLKDPRGAIEHDEIAAYLDPGFAMPRLHLGLLARRAGDRGAARRELVRALELLGGEDASRLLLFGGGFSRDALAALCRAELVACGATA